MSPFWAVLQTGVSWSGVLWGGARNNTGYGLRSTEQGFVIRHQRAVSGGASCFCFGRASLLGLEGTKEGGTMVGVEVGWGGGHGVRDGTGSCGGSKLGAGRQPRGQAGGVQRHESLSVSWKTTLRFSVKTENSRGRSDPRGPLQPKRL